MVIPVDDSDRIRCPHCVPSDDDDGDGGGYGDDESEW